MMWMRSVLPVVVLLGLAVFFVMRGDQDAEGNEEGVGQAGGREGRAWSVERGDDKEDRSRVVSTRVLREHRRVLTTESGLQYEMLAEGSGPRPEATSVVKVHYVGTLSDGTVFDSSRERGKPASFPLNGVIKGWTEGLQLMQAGGLYRFVIPPELAYGDRGSGELIPGGSTLTFEVELIEIEKP